jgi:hypothetical protein
MPESLGLAESESSQAEDGEGDAAVLGQLAVSGRTAAGDSAGKSASRDGEVSSAMGLSA